MPFFSSTPKTYKQLERFTPWQQPSFQEAMKLAMGGLRQPQQQFGAGFEPIAQQARTQFQQQTVPGLMERLTGFAGGQGGQQSSALAQMLGQAGAGLESSLAGQKAQYGLQEQELGQRQQQLWQNLLGMGLTPQYDTMEIPGETSGLSDIFGGLGQGISAIAPYAASAYFGGAPMLAAGGAAGLIQLLQSLLSGQNKQGQQGVGMQAPQSSYMARPSAWNINPQIGGY